MCGCECVCRCMSVSPNLQPSKLPAALSPFRQVPGANNERLAPEPVKCTVGGWQLIDISAGSQLESYYMKLPQVSLLLWALQMIFMERIWAVLVSSHGDKWNAVRCSKNVIFVLKSNEKVHKQEVCADSKSWQKKKKTQNSILLMYLIKTSLKKRLFGIFIYLLFWIYFLLLISV